MRRKSAACGLVLLGLARLAPAAEIAALAYHDIVPRLNGDSYAITVEEFKQQMAYLARAGYHPVSLLALERAREGKQALPPKPVLLTFDDGYRSYYDVAYPILRKYGFPSIVSPVTSWIDRRAAPAYVTAEFMTWDELRAVARSPLVEVLSHSDHLHHNVAAGPFGARVPAAVARLYDEHAGTYETEAAHRSRISADLARSAQRLRAELGISPRGVTWPYGRYDQAALDAAAALGMRYYLTLDDEPTRLASLPRINRATFRDYRGLSDLGDALTFRSYRRREWRFVAFDLAALARADHATQMRLITELERRVEVLRVNAVVLRPFTADGKRALFHTEAMPVAADVLSEVAYQINDRAQVAYLILRVPATLDQRVYADLARLNWFSAAVIEDADAAGFKRVAAVLRSYRPDLKIGVDGREPSVPGADFRLIDLAADLPAEVRAKMIRQVQSDRRPCYFLIERTPTVSTAALRATMAALRGAGVLHFGYGPDDYAHDSPAFLDVVRPLAAYAIPAARR